MSFGLDGKVAIVTGASRGIGQAIAETYAREGAKVIVSSRDLARVAPVAEAIQAAGGAALAVACHTGDEAQVKSLAQAALDSFGRIDIVVNNAGTNPYFGPTLYADDGIWSKTLDTNVLGYMRVIRAAVPAMQQVGGGRIINVASTAGITPMPGLGVYAVTKAAVIHMTKVLAQELGGMNIQVNAIAPGVIRTRFSRMLWETPQISERVLRGTPAGRIGEVEDVVGAALYLASPLSDYTTGTVMVMDGGALLGSVEG